MQLQELVHNHFEGGITDNFVDGPTHKYQVADNLLITTDAKLLTRYGSAVWDEDFYQIPAGSARVGALISFNPGSVVDDANVLLINSARNIYYVDFQLTDAFYNNLGLAIPAYSASWQTLIGYTGNPALSAGSTASHLSHFVWNKHTFLANDAYSSPMKLYTDGQEGEKLVVVNAGLPAVDTSTIAVGGVAGAKNYVYAFVYERQYWADTLQFRDDGPVELIAKASINEPSVSTVAITGLPVLSNGSTENYAIDASLSGTGIEQRLAIYRTTDGGTVYYKVGSVANGTTSFNDTTSDASLINNELLYTTGGVVQNDPPPKAKYITIVNDIAYYGHLQELVSPGGSTTRTFKNRVRFSKQGDPDGCPEDFFVDVEDEIVGLGGTISVPMVFCKRKIYRLDGVVDDLGRGLVTHQCISDTIGCVSHNSIVQTREGIFFAGTDGFYFTDGYNILKISDEFNTTYKALVQTEAQGKNIYGAYDKENGRVYWAVQRADASLDNDAWFIADTRFGIKRDTPFTTASGGDSFRPTAIAYHNNVLHRADTRGYILAHDEDHDTDPDIDTGATPDLWDTATVLYEYRSCATQFGLPGTRKWVPKILATADNISNLSLQISAINDVSEYLQDLVEIRFRGNLFWGDEDVLWGEDGILWNYVPLIEQRRRFPAGGLRCSYKQIVMTNAYTVISNSDTIGTATVNATANTVLLDDLATFDWPSDARDYFIHFADDDYEEGYLITTRTDDTLTVADPSNTLTDGSKEWMIKGYRREEKFKLLSYVVYFMPSSQTQRTFNAGDLGENA